MIVVLSAPLLIGSVGFATDAAFWYSQQASLQTATDAAAMSAARVLATNPGTTSLNADALAAANQATQNQFNFTSFNVKQLDDSRQVEVDATIPGPQFLSSALRVLPFGNLASVNIHASSQAGISYNAVSSQATCYSIDSYSYLFSTGLGMINTAHSSGLDPYQCGGATPTPPPSYQAFCGTSPTGVGVLGGSASGNGGVLGCNLDLADLSTGLLPFAILIGPNPPAKLTNYNTIIAPVIDTLGALENLLAKFSDVQTSSMTVLGNGNYCSGSSCTLPAGTYDGGVTIPAGLTVSFGSGTFDIENGDFIVSNQATLTNNALLYFGGTTPGGLVQTTQLQFNTAAIKKGFVTVNSQTTFTSNSLVGTQTSSPISALSAVETAETGDLFSPVLVGTGLLQSNPLSFLGLPDGNVAGTNFVAVNATCPQATSACDNTHVQIQTPVTKQYTALPSLSGTVATIAGLLGLQNIPLVALLIQNEGETSITTVQSAATLQNGVPTDWWQKETTSATMTNVLQNLNGVLSYLGLTSAGPIVEGVINTLLSTAGLQSPSAASPSYANSGIYPGQVSVTSPNAGSCSGSQNPSAPQTLYSATITPGFTVTYSDILDSGGANNPQGRNGALQTTDTITVCGTRSDGLASIAPLTASTPIVPTTAGGSSTVVLLP